MMALRVALAAIPRRASRFGEALARHPEWWMLAISAGAWLIMAVPAGHSLVLSICASASAGPVARLRAWPVVATLAPVYVDWLMMSAAMMLPLAVLPVRHVAFRSFARRRDRAVAEFLLGYLARWALAGVVLVPLAIAVRALAPSGGVLAMLLGFVLAAAWQWMPLKRHALRRCHRRVPLAPVGWRADVDCLRFGLGIGGDCVLSCWALMLTPLLASHGLIAMIAIQAIALYERYDRQPRIKMVTPVLLACAAVADYWLTPFI